MAKPNTTREHLAPANDTRYRVPVARNIPDRFLKVADIADYPQSTKTTIRLSGAWLKRAGFVGEMQVRVRVMPGCLVITLQE